MKIIRRMLFVVLFAVVGFPLSAQKKPDSTAYRFRFVAEDDMFFVPWSGNGQELDRLIAAVDENRPCIDAGQMYILVTSYGTDGNDRQTASQVANIRRLRLKSELIMRCSVKESNFVTDRSFAEAYKDENGKLRRNLVVVTLPAPIEKVEEIAGQDAAAKVRECNNGASGETGHRGSAKAVCETSEMGRISKEKAEAERIAAEEKAKAEIVATEKAEQECIASGRTVHEQGARVRNTPYSLSLRANLLRWATLTTDLGMEWRVGNSVGILVNGSYTSWSWKDKDRRYGLWEVSPEVRYYIGKEKRGYVGAMYKAGSFNYKFSETGKQGNLMGGGITGGYLLKLNKVLSLDFSLGVGYLKADYDKYVAINGVRVRQGKESKNWWGPVSAGVTLVWPIF